jgi:hypothetical protein
MASSAAMNDPYSMLRSSNQFTKSVHNSQSFDALPGIAKKGRASAYDNKSPEQKPALTKAKQVSQSTSNLNSQITEHMSRMEMIEGGTSI